MVNFRINYVRKLHLLHFVSNCAQWEIYMGQSQNKYSLFHLFFQVLCIYYQPNLWLKIWANNVKFIPINLIIFKAPPVQIWSSCCTTGFTYFPFQDTVLAEITFQGQPRFLHVYLFESLDYYTSLIGKTA